MRKWLLGFFLFLGFSLAQTIPDPNSCLPETVINVYGELKSRLQWQFYQAFEGDITCGQLQSLTEWSAQVGTLDDLSGLEYAINLENLSLKNVPLSRGLQPLGNLKKLKQLDISCVPSMQWPSWCGQLSDISALEHLSTLESLTLEGQAIQDVSALASLTQLPSISLSTNYIESIGPLAALKNLRHLDLSHNDITDISPLASLVNLEELYLEGNCLESLEPLTALKNLQKLSIGGDPHDIKACQFKDFSPLAELKELRVLRITDSNFQDLSLFYQLPHLDLSQGLVLSRNNITNIKPLVEMKNLDKLTTLFLDGNNLSYIQPLTQYFYALNSEILINFQDNCLNSPRGIQALTELSKHIEVIYGYESQVYQKEHCFTRIPAPWGP